MSKGTLNVLSLEDAELWRGAVNEAGAADVYYRPEYAMAYEANGDGRAKLFAFRHTKGIVLYPLLVRSIGSTYFDVTSPYGYSGPLISSSTSDCHEVGMDFRTAFDEYCRDSGIVSEFTRFHPVLATHRIDQPAEYVRDTVYLDLTSSLDTIWDQSLDGRSRTAIRKAERLGVEVVFGDDPSFVYRFEQLYLQTMQRLNAGSYYYFSSDFFRALAETVPSLGTFAEARYDGTTIASILLLRGNRVLHYHLAGSDPVYRNIPANNLLLYRSIQWGQARGLKVFHLGGGYAGNEDSLFRFKAGFSPLRGQYYIGKAIHLQSVYDELVQQRFGGAPPSAGFFPLYRYP